MRGHAMTELSAEDLRIVDMSLVDVRSEDVPRLRRIHEEGLRSLAARLAVVEHDRDGVRRSIAMRAAALDRLAAIAARDDKAGS